MPKILSLKSEFSKNVATLFTGTFIAQSLPVLISPILTRLYTPQDFGIFGFYIAVLGIFAVVANARFELAIILPEKNSDALNIIAIALVSAVLVAIFSALVIFIFQYSFLGLFDIKSDIFTHAHWLWLVPLAVLMSGTYQVFNYWSSRNKTFKVNAISRILQSGGNAAVSTGLGFLAAGPIGLITGYLFGQLMAIAVLLKNFFTGVENKTLREGISKTEMKKNASRYKSFALVNSPHALLGAFQENGVIFLLSAFFATPIVGFYSFVIRVLRAPLNIAGSSISQVFYQKAAAIYNEGGSMRGLVISIYRKLFIAGLPVFAILFFFSPPLFGFVFGEQWREAGEISRILVPWLFLNFIVSPVSTLPLIVNKQKEGFLISVVDIFLRYGSLIVGGISGNYKFAFLLFSIWGSLQMLFTIWWFYKISGITKPIPKS